MLVPASIASADMPTLSDGVVVAPKPVKVRSHEAVHGRGISWLAAGSITLPWLSILSHVPLIAGGRWDGDEVFNFFHFRQSGLQLLAVSLG
jgi:hypothetical protein